MKLLNLVSFTAAAVLSISLFSQTVYAQSAEQIEQLRQRAQQTGSSSTSSTAAGVSPLSVQSQRTLPGAGSAQSTMGQFSTQPRDGLSLPGEPTIESVFPQQKAMANPPLSLIHI